jgi:murein L,D-transpeptidase YafK
MVRRLRAAPTAVTFLVFLALALPAGARTPAQVTEVRVDKSEHTLELRAGDEVVRRYKVALGIGGAGHKQFEGDKTTPVGTYRIAGRFKGLFHQFLNVTYPNDADRIAFAERKARGEVPEGRGIGFGIGVHGVGSRDAAGIHKESDWTHGCIALDDDEVDELSRLVADGTRLVITD